TGKILFRTDVKLAATKERRSQYPFAAISPHGRLVAIPTGNLDQVGFWDGPGKRPGRPLTNKAPKGRKIDHLAVSSDGKQGFAGGENIVYRWDWATGAALPSLEGNTGYGPPRTFTSGDGKILVTVDDNGMIRRWDPATGRQVEAPHGYAPYTMTDLSADGRYCGGRRRRRPDRPMDRRGPPAGPPLTPR